MDSTALTLTLTLIRSGKTAQKGETGQKRG